ncbi:MAG: acetyl-CoA carboxylase biotin carboxylase subunit [Candidatus Melainabacteria bacterium]|nr:acetyl-CoA carboxylase biotin carboxylase subunit [Candidatus Melainabacteria bacterium]
MFKKVLIANRGEIAVRVIQACRELGLETVAIFSEPDKDGKHVQMASERWRLEGQPAKVYLDGTQILDIAKRAGADAIHPGYGFLAENADFARQCAEAGVKFIGPSPEVIHRMGSKIESRRVMDKAGVPVVPGTTDPVKTTAEVIELGKKYGYPIAIKASAGGGGRGLRVVRKEEDVEQALAGAQREGASYFGSDEVYVEKYLDQPRHIEVQIIADEHGNIVHLYERDCSSQRRHQKLLEEAPAAKLDKDLRARLTAAAVKAAAALGYSSAGTVECMVSGKEFYFLEVNTRIQVEHPISESITGIDIVKEQLLIAAGNKLSFTQEQIIPRGHAIECRINAEDPFKNFMPSPGTLNRFELPHHPWVRIDTACYPGYTILPFYDSLLAKLVVWGRTREEAIARTKVALKHFIIEGVSTTIPWHLAMLEDAAFKSGEVFTTYVEQDFMKRFAGIAAELNLTPAAKPAAGSTGAAGNGNGQAPANAAATENTIERSDTRNFEVDVNQKVFKVAVTEMIDPTKPRTLIKPGTSTSGMRSNTSGSGSAAQKERAAKTLTATANAAGSGKVQSTMHGLVKEIIVKEGAAVKTGEKVMIFEAMKMESDIVADRDGVVKEIKVKSGQTVDAHSLLMVIGD